MVGLTNRFTRGRPTSQTQLLVEDETYEYYEEEVVTDDDEGEEYYEEVVIDEQTVSSDEEGYYSCPTKIMPIRLSQRMTMFDAPDLDTLEEASVETETYSQRSESSLFGARRRESISVRKDRLHNVTITNLASLPENSIATTTTTTASTSESTTTEQTTNQSTCEEPSPSARRGSNKQSLPPSPLPRHGASSCGTSSRPPKPGKTRSSSELRSRCRNRSLPRRTRSDCGRHEPSPEDSNTNPNANATSLDPSLSTSYTKPSPIPPRRRRSSEPQSQQPILTTNMQEMKEGMLMTAGLNDTTEAKNVELLDAQQLTSTPVSILPSPEPRIRKQPLSYNTSGSDKSLHSEATESTVATTPPGSPSSLQPMSARSTGSAGSSRSHGTPRRSSSGANSGEDRRSSRCDTANGSSSSVGTPRTSHKRGSVSRNTIEGGVAVSERSSSKPRLGSSRSKSPRAGRDLQGTPRTRRGSQRDSVASSDSQRSTSNDERTESLSSLGNRLSNLSNLSPGLTKEDADMRSMNSSLSSRRSHSERHSSRSGASGSRKDARSVDTRSVDTRSLGDASTASRPLSHRSSMSMEDDTKPPSTSSSSSRRRSETNSNSRRESGVSAVKAAALRRQMRKESSQKELVDLLTREDNSKSSLLSPEKVKKDRQGHRTRPETKDRSTEKPKQEDQKATQSCNQSINDSKMERGRPTAINNADRSPPKPSRKLSLDDLLARLPAEQSKKGRRDAKSTASGMLRRKKKGGDRNSDDAGNDDNDCQSMIEGKFARPSGGKRPSGGSSKKERSKSLPSKKRLSEQKDKKKERSKSLKRPGCTASSKPPTGERSGRNYSWWNLEGGEERPYLAADTNHSKLHDSNELDSMHDSIMSTGSRNLMESLNTPTQMKKGGVRQSPKKSPAKTSPSGIAACVKSKDSHKRSKSSPRPKPYMPSAAPPKRFTPERSKSDPDQMTPQNTSGGSGGRLAGTRPTPASSGTKYVVVESPSPTKTISKPPLLSPLSSSSGRSTVMGGGGSISGDGAGVGMGSAKVRMHELETIKEFLTAEEYEQKRKEILSSI
jgi:hypothetical protein